MDEGVGNAASQELLQPPVAKNAMGSGSPPPAKNAKGSGDPAAQVGEEPPKAMEIVNRKLEVVGAQMMAAGLNFGLQDAKGIPGNAQVLTYVTICTAVSLFRA
jgi:hypothetical protein